FVTYSRNDAPPAPVDNHSRKYVELLRLTERGPVALWLVAAQARWPVLASRVGSRIEFEPSATVQRSAVLDATAPPGTGVAVPEPAMLTPNIDHALAVAGLTERDGQQRRYEFPWAGQHEFEVFINELRPRLASMAVVHARPWRWQSESGGAPM